MYMYKGTTHLYTNNNNDSSKLDVCMRLENNKSVGGIQSQHYKNFGISWN